MKTLRPVCVVFGFFISLSLWAQVPQLISYQGRLGAGGTNFSGMGQFKFALVNGTGAVSFWSNDGTSVGGSQPAAALALSVSQGLFNVLLGDVTVPNMTVIPASVFRAPRKYKLFIRQARLGNASCPPLAPSTL